MINYILDVYIYFQYFGGALELWKLLSVEVRGTVENSESLCSDSPRLLRIEPWFWLGDQLDAATVAVDLRSGAGLEFVELGSLCEFSLALVESSMASRFSLSSVSFTRKSTHKSAKDWRGEKKTKLSLATCSYNFDAHTHTIEEPLTMYNVRLHKQNANG